MVIDEFDLLPVRFSILAMRKHGMSRAQIAGVIAEIRNWAVREENRRQQLLLEQNPTKFLHHSEYEAGVDRTEGTDEPGAEISVSASIASFLNSYRRGM